MGFKTSALLTTASVLLASAPAFATTFTFDSSNLPGATEAGITKSITTSYNDNTDLFKWSSTYQRNKTTGLLADGLWLVANDGPNPKGHAGELAIYYLDGINQKVSIYEYDGSNSANSWATPGNFLGSTGLNVSKNGNDEITFGFELDATDLNGKALSPIWKGTSFDKNIGLWVHGVTGLDAKYDANGKLTKFKYSGNQSYYDSNNNQATAVPEPASTVALGLFAVAGAFVKRTKQSA